MVGVDIREKIGSTNGIDGASTNGIDGEGWFRCWRGLGDEFKYLLEQTMRSFEERWFGDLETYCLQSSIVSKWLLRFACERYWRV